MVIAWDGRRAGRAGAAAAVRPCPPLSRRFPMLPKPLHLSATCLALAWLVLSHSWLAVSPSQGVAINFVTNDDERLLQDIQRFYNTVIEVRSTAGAAAGAAGAELPSASSGIGTGVHTAVALWGCVGDECIRAAGAAHRQRPSAHAPSARPP